MYNKRLITEEFFLIHHFFFKDGGERLWVKEEVVRGREGCGREKKRGGVERNILVIRGRERGEREKGKG